MTELFMASQGVRRRELLHLCLGTALLPAAMRQAQAQAVPSADPFTLHVINRMGWGPSSPDLMRLQKVGVDTWINQQLQLLPSALPDDLGMTPGEQPRGYLSQREAVSRYREVTQLARRDPESGKAARRELLQQAILDASTARVMRALYSPQQLNEVMVDFWFNHFNVFSGKGMDQVLIASYENEAIRPYALGRFRDMLGATAKHPAMLFYLDNWLSVAPGFQARRSGATPTPGGLNENYARELMELHTLGVDGGYTQTDVTELARMLTGWTFDAKASGPSLFLFNPARHDSGSKRWLGHEVPPAGQQEGEWALDQLAKHPATARHISYKLAQHFVADLPPPGLVQKLAHRFTSSDGDIRSVLETLFASPEFRDPAHFGKKFKTPYRYVLSALRASAVAVRNVRPVLNALQQQGMPLYGCPTPDGYKNTEEAWLNPEAITRRVAFATALGSGRLPLYELPGREGSPSSGGMAAGSPSRQVDTAALLATLDSTLSTRTRSLVASEPANLQTTLVLGSPDFMRH